MSATHIRPLTELRRSDAAEFGGKSANLGELLSAGSAAPPGFAIGSSAFRAFVRANGLEGTIAGALSVVSLDDVDSIGAAANTISKAMRSAPLPNGVRDELVARTEELERAAGEEEPAVAVRSSALGEDSQEASYAGQQESFPLGARSRADLRRGA